MINPWLWLTLAFIVLNWLAVWFEWRVLNLASKPAVIAATL